jgi:hypothetical protein
MLDNKNSFTLGTVAKEDGKKERKTLNIKTANYWNGYQRKLS